MSYIVTLEKPSSYAQVHTAKPHLKAVCDGPNGRLNCRFPMEIFGISRYDFKNAGIKFEVAKIACVEKPTGSFYSISPKDILGVIAASIPRGSSATISSEIDKESEVKSTLDKPVDSSIGDRKAKAVGIADDDSDFFMEQLDEAFVNDDIENSPLVKRMREYKHDELEMKESLIKKTMTPFILTETLFEQVQVPMLQIGNKKYTLAQIGSPEVFQMINSPLFRDGMPKLETWILIKLYDATISPGTTYTDIGPDGQKGVKRGELLRRVGTARDAASQTSTYFNAYKVLGLAYLNDGIVYPGPNLDSWLHGDLEVAVPTTDPKYDAHIKKYEKWPNGYDLSKFFGLPDLEKKTPCATKSTTAKNTADAAGEGEDGIMSWEDEPVKKSSPKDLFPDLDMVKKDTSDDIFTGDATVKSTKESRKANAIAADDDFFESFDANNDNDLYASAKIYDNAKTDEYRAAYRESLNLDENYQFAEDSLDDHVFTHLCNMNGWNPEYARNRILGR